MRMSLALKPLFDCPVDDILAVLPDDADPIWGAFQVRQSRSNVHLATRSILFKWLDDFVPLSADAVITTDYPPAPLTRAVLDCVARFEDYYGNRAVRVLLIDLRAGGHIPIHMDRGRLLDETHRCHVPITTNPDVLFTIGDERFHLEQGVAFEMDNMRVHGAVNGGATRRVHLVCNILPSPSHSRA